MLASWQETCAPSLIWEDTLEKGTATHSSILAWRILLDCIVRGTQRVRHDWANFTFHFLGRKAITNLGSVLKSKDITLLTNFGIVKAMIFPVVMYGCESWTIKKAEHQRTDAFELWCWRRLLRIHWITRRSNWSTLKEINPKYSLEGLMLKLKLK